MDRMEQLIVSRIDRGADEIRAFAEDIYRHAEIGYAEHRTARKTADAFRRLGLTPETGIASTGVRASLGSARPSLCMIGELDGIRCPTHPYAVPETGMSHACGHHMQLAAMIGAAMALSDPEIAAQLGGRVDFFAVPSEEHVPMERLEQLHSQGIASLCGGKCELLARGAFNETDAALTTHTHMVPCGSDLLLGSNSSSGFVTKMIHITGKPAHAAIAPHEGINAQDAAAVARTAVAMQRSTFRESDCVRVSEIVSLGSSAVNVIPGQATVDIQVRAKNREAMLEVNRMVTRCYEGAAHAFGAQAEIRDGLGYLPVIPAAPIPELTHAAQLLAGEVTSEPVNPLVHNAASTDVGDLSHLMPVINFTFGGFIGTLHGADFCVTDAYKGLIVPAKIAALTIYRLMKDNAAGLRRVISEYHAPMSHADYLDYVHSFHPDLFA